MGELEDPVTVRLHNEFGRDKLSLGDREWITNEDDGTPRKGNIYKGRTYKVDRADHVIRHFLDGNDLVQVDDDGDEVSTPSFEEQLQELPGIGEGRASTIADDFTNYEEFVEESDAEYLSEEVGLGASRVEEVLNEL